MCCMQFCFPPQPSFFPFCVNRPSRASIQRWLPAAVRCPSRCCTGPHPWRRAPRGAHKKCPGRKSRHQPAPWQRNFVRKWSPKNRWEVAKYGTMVTKWNKYGTKKRKHGFKIDNLSSMWRSKMVKSWDLHDFLTISLSLSQVSVLVSHNKNQNLSWYRKSGNKWRTFARKEVQWRPSFRSIQLTHATNLSRVVLEKVRTVGLHIGAQFHHQKVRDGILTAEHRWALHPLWIETCAYRARWVKTQRGRWWS